MSQKTIENTKTNNTLYLMGYIAFREIGTQGLGLTRSYKGETYRLASSPYLLPEGIWSHAQMHMHTCARAVVHIGMYTSTPRACAHVYLHARADVHAPTCTCTPARAPAIAQIHLRHSTLHTSRYTQHIHLPP